MVGRVSCFHKPFNSFIVNSIVMDPSTCPGMPAARQPSSLPVNEIHVVHMFPFSKLSMKKISLDMENVGLILVVP
eukprot:8820564-Ditylum_brightwellii.AAC.1